MPFACEAVPPAGSSQDTGSQTQSWREGGGSLAQWLFEKILGPGTRQAVSLKPAPSLTSCVTWDSDFLTLNFFLFLK